MALCSRHHEHRMHPISEMGRGGAGWKPWIVRGLVTAPATGV
jgi:hypothetical protein